MLCDSDMEELEETLRHALKLKSRVELGRIFPYNRWGYITHARNGLNILEAIRVQEGYYIIYRFYLIIVFVLIQRAFHTSRFTSIRFTHRRIFHIIR